MNKKNDLKILVLDLETAPLLGYVWGLWENNVALNQIYKESHILSYAAKWYTDKNGTTFGPHNKVMYGDQSKEKNIENDKKLLDAVWNLMNDCDILITQNGQSFDTKRINARFILNKMPPPSPYRNIDTLRISKKVFSFTSNKLEWLTEHLCKTNKKMKTKKYQGFNLWKACLDGDKKAFAELKAYNVMDILSLEELYHVMSAWDTTAPNFNVYNDSDIVICNCGSPRLQKRGFNYPKGAKHQRFVCLGCGNWSSSKDNLLSKEKRKSLLKRI